MRRMNNNPNVYKKVLQVVKALFLCKRDSYSLSMGSSEGLITFSILHYDKVPGCYQMLGGKVNEKSD